MHKQDLLRSETQRAMESGQLKSLFLANMTHEIRTPINAIVGFSEILSSLTSSEEKKEVIQIIKNNCDMLLRLINDILTASSLESGQVSIEPVEVDFAKKFNELFESLRPRVQEPGVEFVKDNPYTTLPIKIDTERVSQVITNFLTNAVKYTHQGYIKLGYRTEARATDGEQRKGLYIYCEDTGDGISQESQHKIFERFFKVNDFVQGTGLGLSICKAFADACHGDIGVISEGKGKGSTFWMWIPI
jgi:signal transduction histidine kinase